MLSKIAQNITPSATCELEGVVADMKAAGVDIIGMNAGEPDFDTPENIRDACKWALDEGKTRYVNVPGIADLRKAICEKLKKDNGCLLYTSCRPSGLRSGSALQHPGA